MIGLWLKGALIGRRGRVIGSVVGLALTVALLASLGSFVASSTQTMARRALANVAIDWQVLLAPTGGSGRPSDAIHQAAPSAFISNVGYADTAGFTAVTGNTTQTTGAGKAVGIEADYAAHFPAQVSVVLGKSDGVFIATQTAANLHVSVGDSVTVQRIGLPPVDVTIAGVGSMPNADSFFQAIGVPKGTAPQAPPDNVLVMPMKTWHALFDAQRAARPDTVRNQLHVRLDHASLPADPGAAYVQAQGLANHVEVLVAGNAAIANNLAARLDGVRADALYAQVLFLFLGAPGVVLALLVTLAVTTSGADRRRREQGLLRIRGASVTTLLKFAAGEAVALGSAGVLLGLLLAAITARLSWQIVEPALAAPWYAFAAGLGLMLATAAFVVPAWREATRSTVAAARSEFAPAAEPVWQRVYLDLILLAIGGIVFWRVAQTGYQIVLATEGVAQTSVHYEAFLAPLCLWLSAGLLWIRFCRLLLRRGVGRLAGRLVERIAGAGALAPLISASLKRQSKRIAGATTLVALAFAFATATAIFNTTYDRQSRVDAELTNGADVTVTGTSTAPAAALIDGLRKLPGVAVAEPLMHRMAYVGADLQDMFGIDAARITQVTTVADAYFTNHDARKSLALLQRTPDGVLVAEETVKDFQLKPGDELNLRLQDARSHQYRSVRFHFIGTVREFPTAPKDSFLVANASYLAQQTGSAAAERVLLRSSGDIEALGRAARALAAKVPGTKVTTLGETQSLISSSLTAVDLHQLTRLELGFSVLLIAVIAGVVLSLNLAERRRSFAILTSLGATASQVGAFLWSEGLFIVFGGMALGTVTGFAIAKTLVTILAGVFDPPPESLIVPWGYLGITAVTALTCATLAILVMRRLIARRDLELLRAQ